MRKNTQSPVHIRITEPIISFAIEPYYLDNAAPVVDQDAGCWMLEKSAAPDCRNHWLIRASRPPRLPFIKSIEHQNFSSF